MKVTMSELEMAKARAFARAVVANHQERGTVSTYRHEGPNLAIQALGAAAEIAVGRALDLPWDDRLGGQPPGCPDVGPLHIRHTMHDGGCLLLHPRDPDEPPFVLVTGKPPDLTIRGWIAGQAGKQEWFWMERVEGRACYFVPQKMLRPLAELEAALDLWRKVYADSLTPNGVAEGSAVASLPLSALMRAREAPRQSKAASGGTRFPRQI